MSRTDEIKEVKSTTKLDEEQAGTGSPMNNKPSPPQQKVQSLGIHADPYRERKDRATK
jgi:hypothetical protein